MCRQSRTAQIASSVSATTADVERCAASTAYSIPALAMNTGHMPSTILTSRRHRLTSHVVTASATTRPSACRPTVRSNMSALSQRGAAVTGLDEQDLNVAQHALGKTAFAVAEVVLPHADEGLVVAERANLREI